MPVRHPFTVALAGLVLLGALILANDVSAQQANEVRALWVARASLTSPATVEAVVKTAHDYGFNTLLVEVRGHADSYLRDAVEPTGPEDPRSMPIFDALQALITCAHANTLRVHAWINVNLVTTATNLPASRNHIVYRHPEWLMVPRNLADQLAKLQPGNPSYLGTLLRWTREHAEIVKGLYLSPLTAGATAYTAGVLANLVAKYPVDGVHLDSLYYPDNIFDYSRTAMDELRADVRPRLSVAARSQLDSSNQPFDYADHYPERWTAFRRSRLTALLMRLRTVVKTRRPTAVFSAALVPDEFDARTRRLQDWRTWLDGHLLDVACPIGYTQDTDIFETQIATIREIATSSKVWAGIDAYRLSPSQTINNIQAARRQRVDGVALFSYDSLTDPAQHEINYLAEVSRAAFRLDAVAPESQ